MPNNPKILQGFLYSLYFQEGKVARFNQKKLKFNQAQWYIKKKNESKACKHLRCFLKNLIYFDNSMLKIIIILIMMSKPVILVIFNIGIIISIYLLFVLIIWNCSITFLYRHDFYTRYALICKDLWCY